MATAMNRALKSARLLGLVAGFTAACSLILTLALIVGIVAALAILSWVSL